MVMKAAAPWHGMTISHLKVEDKNNILLNVIIEPLDFKDKAHWGKITR